MPARIHHIETLVPPHVCSQADVRDRLMAWLPGRRAARLIRAIFDRTAIETRYSVLPDFTPGLAPVLYRTDDAGRVAEPSTGTRNAVYAGAARVLGVEVARKAIDRCDGIQARDVTHVITVSCTGFCNPGADLDIVQALGLRASVQRYNLGFMGCYAALPALRMAQQFCDAGPESVVLVVCLELCTLHMQLSEAPDSLLANALFSDGTAAAVVSARKPAPHLPTLALHSFSSALAPEGASDMAWTIGDRGFNIQLSTYVPAIIAANVAGIVEDALGSSPWNASDIQDWAIHPGGRSILDNVEQRLALRSDQIADSRAVLKHFGNMSSATILFVLQRLLARDHGHKRRSICAMAFGPGLTIESALMERIPAADIAATPDTAERVELHPA